MNITGKDRVYLRGLGHRLKPILQVGKEGITGEFILNLEDCQKDHELLKIRILESAPAEKKEIAEEIEKATKGAVVQIIGKTLLYYHPFKEEPVIKLPSRSK